MNDTTEKPTTVEGEIVIEADSTKEDGNKDLAENHNSAALVPVTPNQLLAMAVEQGADVDKLEKLLQLQERWEANEAKKAFVAAMNAFKANPPEILKSFPLQSSAKFTLEEKYPITKALPWLSVAMSKPPSSFNAPNLLVHA